MKQFQVKVYQSVRFHLYMFIYTLHSNYKGQKYYMKFFALGCKNIYQPEQLKSNRLKEEVKKKHHYRTIYLMSYSEKPLQMNRSKSCFGFVKVKPTTTKTSSTSFFSLVSFCFVLFRFKVSKCGRKFLIKYQNHTPQYFNPFDRHTLTQKTCTFLMKSTNTRMMNRLIGWMVRARVRSY